MKPIIIDYELVRGTPAIVDARVKELLSYNAGWQPKGKIVKTVICEYEILVQQMVKYES